MTVTTTASVGDTGTASAVADIFPEVFPEVFGTPVAAPVTTAKVGE